MDVTLQPQPLVLYTWYTALLLFCAV